MATFRRLPSGLWQVQVFRRGIRKSASFPAKAAAVAWAGRVESEIMAGVRGEIPNLTVQALLDRYKAKVSSKKKGRQWEEVRLDALGRDELAQVRLRVLDTPHVAAWQERRLDAVSGASVRRERNLLNHVFNKAINEWKWLTKNPFQGMPRPKDGKPRKRIASPAEITQLSAPPGALSDVILFAIETGCRAGEIGSLNEGGGGSINGTVATVIGKTGERDVPLSPKAIALFPEGGFGLTAGSISTLFARRCKEMGIKGLTFHDLRATAATKWSKKLDSTRLTRMFGWKDTKHVMIYYRETTEDIAKLL